MIVAIGAGHTPKSPGVKYKNIIEYTENLKVTTRIQIELSRKHIEFHDFKGSLRQKVDYINLVKPDVAIEIHHNYHWDSDIRGTELIYHPTSQKGKLLAEKIMRAFFAYPDSWDRISLREGYYRYDKSKGFYYFTSHTKMPAIILECVYVSNPEDRLLMFSVGYLNKIAKSVVEGIKNYAET
jgi:N-acetylmuramoyl-L-alanine amidase